MSLISFLWADLHQNDQHDTSYFQFPRRSSYQYLRSKTRDVVFALLVLLVLHIPSVFAKRFSPLSVGLEEQTGVLEFSFGIKSESFSVSRLKVERDLPNRLKITADGVRCRRAWQRGWKAEGLKRALLYPSKSAKGRCFLKIKMERKISQEQLDSIQIIQQGASAVVRFAWKPSQLNSGVALLESNDSPSSDTDAQNEEKPSKSTRVIASKELDPNTDQEETTVNLIEEGTDIAPNEQSKPAESNPSKEESSSGIAEEAPIGELADMKVEEDRLGIQERPHSIIETVTIGQVEKARAYSPAPIILSTPISLSGDDRSETDEGFLQRASIFFGALLDREALSRGGSIWLTHTDLREQSQKLNTNHTQLSISQERLIAKHIGANLISRAQLSIDDSSQKNSLSLSVSMNPVEEDAPIAPADPGVYRVKHQVSRALIEEALQQTWVEERRDDAILRAVLVPGLGHIYRGETRLGWTYLSSSLALTFGALLSGTLGYLASKDYEGNSPSSAHRRDDANAHYDRANLLLMGVGTLYVSSLVDTIISAQDRSYLDLDRLNWDGVRQRVESRGGR